VDGLHFQVRSADSLAAAMARAMTEPGLWERLHGNVRPPPTAAAVALEHIAKCYEAKRARTAAAGTDLPPQRVAAAST
jgi:hypothetical protein